jgi:hypothetical protein
MKFRKLIETIVEEPKEAIGLRAFYTNGVWMSSYFYYDEYKTKDDCLASALRCCDHSNGFEIQYIIPGVNDRGNKDGAYRGRKYQLLYVTFRHGVPTIQTKDTRIKYNPISNKMFLDTATQTSGTYWSQYKEDVESIAQVLTERGFEVQGWYMSKYHLKKEIQSNNLLVQAIIEEVKSKYRCTLTAVSPKKSGYIMYEDIPYNKYSDVSIKRFTKKVENFLNTLSSPTKTEYTPINEFGESRDFLVFQNYVLLNQLIKRFKIFTDNYTMDSGKLFFRNIPFLEEEQLCKHIESFYDVTKKEETLDCNTYHVIEFFK